jgi:hypothetical protein
MENHFWTTRGALAAASLWLFLRILCFPFSFVLSFKCILDIEISSRHYVIAEAECY